MNRSATLVTTAVAVVLTASLSGCGAHSPSESVASTAPVSYPQPAFRTALLDHRDTFADGPEADYFARSIDQIDELLAALWE